MSTSHDTEQNQGLGRGWWAAAGFVAALVVGLIFVLIRGGHGGSSATPTPTPSTEETSSSSSSTLTTPSAAAPATPAPSNGAGAPGVEAAWGDTGCNGHASSSGDPLGQLSATTWTPFITSALPSSSTLGPAKTDGDIRRCFAHSPAGAVMAAANLSISIYGDNGDKIIATQWTAGPGKDKAESDLLTSSHQPANIAGYALSGCTATRCNVNLAVVQGGQYASGLVPLVWRNGDWFIDGSVVPADGTILSTFPAGHTQWGPTS